MNTQISIASSEMVEALIEALDGMTDDDTNYSEAIKKKYEAMRLEYIELNKILLKKNQKLSEIDQLLSEKNQELSQIDQLIFEKQQKIFKLNQLVKKLRAPIAQS